MSVIEPAAVTVAALLASDTAGGASVVPPSGITWPLTLRLTIVDEVNVPLPLKPTSHRWPTWIGWIQEGFVAV